MIQIGKPVTLPDPTTVAGSQQTGSHIRFRLVDALRGLAALAVVLHHALHNSALYNEMETSLRSVLAWPILVVSDHGLFGVHIFFVISGFVIAHSLRHTEMSRGSVMNFILRRQVRLDPPYWTALTFCLLLAAFKHHVLPAGNPPPPGFVGALCNYLYLYNIVGAPAVLGVAWTLCIEVQFYLAFIMLLVCTTPRVLSNPAHTRRDYAPLLVFVTGAMSLFLNGRTSGVWFTCYWFYFAAGVLCHWAVTRRTGDRLVLGFVALFGIPIIQRMCAAEPQTSLWAGSKCINPYTVGCATVLLLYVAGKRGTLTTWGSFRALQYLGRISYSLYLVHLPLIIIVLRLAQRLVSVHPVGLLLFYLLALCTSIGAAHMLHIWVERPAMELATRIKSRPGLRSELNWVRDH